MKRLIYTSASASLMHLLQQASLCCRKYIVCSFSAPCLKLNSRLRRGKKSHFVLVQFVFTCALTCVNHYVDELCNGKINNSETIFEWNSRRNDECGEFHVFFYLYHLITLMWSHMCVCVSISLLLYNLVPLTQTGNTSNVTLLNF